MYFHIIVCICTHSGHCWLKRGGDVQGCATCATNRGSSANWAKSYLHLSAATLVNTLKWRYHLTPHSQTEEMCVSTVHTSHTSCFTSLFLANCECGCWNCVIVLQQPLQLAPPDHPLNLSYMDNTTAVGLLCIFWSRRPKLTSFLGILGTHEGAEKRQTD